MMSKASDQDVGRNVGKVVMGDAVMHLPNFGEIYAHKVKRSNVV